MRTWLGFLASVALGVLVVMAIAGSSRLSGPVLLAGFSTHGLHAGDLVTLLAASVGLGAIIALARR
ncbi:MAG: hypothetical protein ABGZ36_20035 [Actinomycetota bacterium]